MIAGITRVRNEALIIKDTLNHFLQYVDHIFLYDDCSTDDTVWIAREMPGCRISILHGDEWRSDRVAENTRHRAALLDLVKRHGGYEWCLCFDADERLVGNLPISQVTGRFPADGYTFRLFDGYLTPEHRNPYEAGKLEHLNRMWGPEYRDILMLFRTDKARYDAPGMRSPSLDGMVSRAPMLVKHYGKCLSVDHWEETCNYYADNFQGAMQSKWQARKGKAIHTGSDQGRELYEWGPDLRANGVKLK